MLMKLLFFSYSIKNEHKRNPQLNEVGDGRAFGVHVKYSLFLYLLCNMLFSDKQATGKTAKTNVHPTISKKKENSLFQPFFFFFFFCLFRLSVS